MKAEGTDFLIRGGWIRTAEGFGRHLTAARLDSVEAASSRAVGLPVTNRRSSWGPRMDIDSIDCYVKTYDYPTTRDRLRGALRTTVLARSRAWREAAALDWLTASDFAGPRALAVGERRRAGWLTRAVLITAAWPGPSLDVLLPGLPAVERAELLRALQRFVERLHTAGFRDRNLDPRNLLAHRTGARTWAIAKIDSPRFRLTAPGRSSDRARLADRDRLAAGLAELGCALPAGRP